MDGVEARSLRPLRVSIVNQSRAWGGAEVHTAALAAALSARGHRVRLVEFGSTFIDRRTDGSVQTFEVCEGRPAISFATTSFRAGLAALHGLRGDVVIHPRTWFPSANWRFDLAARFTAAAYVTIEHSTADRMPSPSIHERLTRTVLAFAPQLVVAVSQNTADRLRDIGFNPKKLAVIHNGVDLERFRPDEDVRRTMRARWGIADTDVVFGFAGRLAKEKGLHIAIAAFARASPPSSRSWLILVGDGTQREALAASAAALGVASRVIFEPFTSAVHRVYPAFDHFVLPSLSEALGLSLLEAMASGCAVVATSVGGVPEILSDEEVGWTVPPADVDALAGAMSRALAMLPAERSALGQRARQRVIEGFDSRRQMATLVDLLERRFTKVH